LRRADARLGAHQGSDDLADQINAYFKEDA
jgi:hypothetical protein